MNFETLLLCTAISRCILIFSLRSVRKLSKQSFFSCKQLLSWVLITKMSKLGFSRNFLMWTLNYDMHRKQFVQIDDTCSEVKNVNFGVPQGSILGPVLFNIYVADLQDNVNVKCFQYADDKTIYDRAKISDLNSCRNTIYQSINKLSVWSKESTLAFNNDKTKVMILSTPQMSRVHHLDEYDHSIAVSGYKLERIQSCKLLGVREHQ